MLDAYVIEEIKRREQHRERDDRPTVQVPVPELEGLVLARRCARRHGRAAQVAARHGDLHLHGGVAAGVEDLAGGDVDDLGHGGLQVLGGCAHLPVRPRLRQPSSPAQSGPTGAS
jgi:hypothetical protein